MHPLEVAVVTGPAWGWGDTVTLIVQILVALGTFAAAFAALYISDRERAERVKEQSRIAHVVDKVIGPELQRLLAVSRNIAVALDGLEPHGGVARAGEPISNPREMLAAYVTVLRLPACEAALERLHTLPDYQMNAISEMLGLLPELRNWCEGISKFKTNRIYQASAIGLAQEALGRVGRCYCGYLGVNRTDPRVARLQKSMSMADAADERERAAINQSAVSA
jgi:hypothetical protein